MNNVNGSRELSFEELMQTELALSREATIELRYNQDFCLVPLDERSGIPLIPYAELENPRNRLSWQETRKLFFGNRNGIAALLGAASDYAYCLDDDCGILNEIMNGNPDNLNTLREIGPNPNRSHLFLRDRKCNIGKLDFRLCAPGFRAIECEIKGNGQLVTLAPSLHRKTRSPYRTVSQTQSVREIDGIVDLVIQKMEEIGWKAPQTTIWEGKDLRFNDGKLELSSKQSEDIFLAISELWARGRRHLIQTALIGWLLRVGIKREDVESFVLDLMMNLSDFRDNERWNKAQQQREIKATVNGAVSGKHTYALSTLISIAKSANREDIAKRLLELNREAKMSWKLIGTL